MSRHLHHDHPERIHERWVGDTIIGKPSVSYAERHAPDATFPHPREAAYLAMRRALLPDSVKEWLKEKAALAARAVLTRPMTAPPTSAPLQRPCLAHLTAAEKHQRKLAQTRASNARKRAERKLWGPNK
jgi:hypothetical protein